MIITDIVPYKNKKNKIYIDSEFRFVLYDKELALNKIEKSGEISQEEIDNIVNDIILKRAKAYCNYIFAKEDKTEFQIRKKLNEKLYPSDVIDLVVEYLKENNFINDSEYAKRYVEYKKCRKSIYEIKSKLLQRGVNDTVISSALDGVTDEDQLEAIRYYTNKKLEKNNLDSEQDKAKLKKYLLNKGFDFRLIDL